MATVIRVPACVIVLVSLKAAKVSPLAAAIIAMAVLVAIIVPMVVIFVKP